MKFSPVCFAVVAAIALAPASASAAPKCSKNADLLSGSVLSLNDRGEWCETDSADKARFENARESNFKADVAAEKREELAYQRAMAKYLGASPAAAQQQLAQANAANNTGSSYQ
jgi:hypothetical protein